MDRAADDTGSDSLTILGSYPGAYRVQLWKNVSICVWVGRATQLAAEELVSITQHTIEVVGPKQRFSFVHLVAEGIELPDSGARGVLVQIMKDYADHMGCAAVVLAGTGFWASAMRSFVTGVRVLAPRTFDLRVHAQIAELLEWYPAEHARRTGLEIDPASFLAELARAQDWQRETMAALRGA
jgi:hypothetical protein